MFRGSLLETETKKIEILEFFAGNKKYGVDINEIKEILPYKMQLTSIPNAHPCIEGIIKPRDMIIPIVDLAKALRLPVVPRTMKHMLIVSEMIDINVAFHVESVEGIHKLTESQIKHDNDEITTEVKSIVTGVFYIGNEKIEILDFAEIISIINPDALS